MHPKGTGNDFFSWFRQRQWVESIKNHKTFLVNVYTGEEFSVDCVPIYSPHILNLYKSRAVYPLPNTPKIILPNCHSSTTHLRVWVQRAPYRLDKILHKHCSQSIVLTVLKDVLTILEMVVKKYGFYRLTSKMIKVNKGSLMQVWINQFEQCCHRQFPLNSRNAFEDYRTMIGDLLQIFEENGQTRHIENLIKRLQKQKIITFEKTKTIIDSIIHRKGVKQNFKLMPATISEIPPFILKKQSIKEDSPLEKKGSTKNLQWKKKESPKSEKSLKIKPLKILIKNAFQRETSPNVHANLKLSKEIHKSLGKISTPRSPSEIIERTVEKVKKKRKVRDSSLSSTNFHQSVQSSCKTNSFEEFALTRDKQVTSSFGKKAQGNEKLQQWNEKFLVKASKIIEERSEDAPNSPKSELDFFRVRESELERDINFLLKSSHFLNKNEVEMEKIEEEMYDLLKN